MAYEMILFETQGPVAIITINRPKAMNALSPRWWKRSTRP